jgi:hypothetical protein
MGLESVKDTAKGGQAVDAEVLKELDIPIGNYILDLRKYLKLRDTYLSQFKREVVDGHIHPFFYLTTVTSYRSCIAGYEKVMVVRDFESEPEGIPIKDVKVGDLVYCFDDKLNPQIKKVLWQGKTGHREIIRVHYYRKGKRYYFDCTPEHKVRLIDGSYIEAQNLKPNDHVLACSRTGDYINFTGHLKHGHGFKEHRFIYEQLVGDLNSDEVIHHKNWNHFDHRPENLQKTTRSEHSKIHASVLSNLPERKELARQSMLKRWENNEFSPRFGEDNNSYVFIIRFACLRKLAENHGKLKLAAESIPMDFATFKNKISDYGLDWKTIKLRYDKNGKYISKARLQNLSHLGRSKVQRILGHNYYKLLELYKFYGLDLKRKWSNQFGEFVPGNHRITGIEHLHTSVDVYDIEVEDHHNFFVNEICVHNSSADPNFQNIPKRDKEAKNSIRSGIVPSKGNKLCEIDFSGMEVSTSATYHCDPNFINYLLDDSADMHRDNGCDIWMLEQDEMTPEIRFFVKNGWTFPQFYGDWYDSCGRALWKSSLHLNTAAGITLEEHLKGKGIYSQNEFLEHCKSAENIMWHERFKVYTEWKESINDFYLKNGYVETHMGFRFTGMMDRKQTANFPIQGTAFHLLLFCINLMIKEKQKRKWKSRFIGQVHDSCIIDLVPEEQDEIFEVFDYHVQHTIPETFKWANVPFRIDKEVSPIDGTFAQLEEL